METAITRRGQTVIPAPIRQRYQIKAGDHLVWLDDGEAIRVVVVPSNALGALRGSGRGERLVERLLKSRKEELNREP